jgi:hypothetical protein
MYLFRACNLMPTQRNISRYCFHPNHYIIHGQVRKAYEMALRFNPAHPNALDNMERFFWGPEKDLKRKDQKHVADLPSAPPVDFSGWYQSFDLA